MVDVVVGMRADLLLANNSCMRHSQCRTRLIHNRLYLKKQIVASLPPTTILKIQKALAVSPSGTCEGCHERSFQALCDTPRV